MIKSDSSKHQKEEEESKQELQKLKTQELNVEYTSFEDLKDIFNNDSTETMEILIEKIKNIEPDWKFSFTLITSLRSVNKFHPQFIQKEISNIIGFIQSNAQNLRSNLSKNALMLIKEMFSNQLDLTEDEYCLLVHLTYEKVSSEKQFLKTEANESIKQLTKITSLSLIKRFLPLLLELSNDKNATICQNASSTLYELLSNCNDDFKGCFEDQLLEKLVKTLAELLKGKRAVLKKIGEQICLLFENKFGVDRFNDLVKQFLTTDEQNLVQYSLKVSKEGKQKKNNSQMLQEFLSQQRSKDKEKEQSK